MPPVAVPLLALAAACAPAPHQGGLAAPAPLFDPLVFFAGASHGAATLRIALHAPRAVSVSSLGRVSPDGTLVLDQLIAPAGQTPRRRQWRIRRTGSARYAGTLSDAAGPVAGDVTGNCLHLRFAMKGGLEAQQWLYLQPGGQVALNRMTVGRWGLRIATLEETITRRP